MEGSVVIRGVAVEGGVAAVVVMVQTPGWMMG